MLSKEQIQELRREAVTLKPEVLIGKEGLTEESIRSIYEALNTKALIKVKLLQNSNEPRDAVREKLMALEQITLVQNIGKTYVLYKPLKRKTDGSARNKIKEKSQLRLNHKSARKRSPTSRPSSRR